MGRPEETFSELNRVCQGLMRSVDARYLPRTLYDIPVGEIHRFQEAIRYLREPLSPSLVQRHLDDPAYLQALLMDFVERLRPIQKDSGLSRLIRRANFRISGQNNQKFADPVLHEALFYRNITIDEALDLLERTVSSISLDALLSDKQTADMPAIRALGRVLPSAQVPAPAQFAVEEGRLRIIPQPALYDPEDARNIGIASEELVKNGDKIINELTKSNCDRRLVEGFRELQSHLASREDVIRAGITNVTCSHLVGQFKDELPDALYGMMQGHSVAISMYIAQFPEWRRFADQAATANIDPAHATHIAAAARQIAEETLQHPELADPEVPRLLKFLSEMVSDPSRASRRVAFAVLRTLENLVLTTYSYAKDLFKKTADKTSDKLSSVTARVIVIAVAGAILLGPVAASLPEVTWVKTATELIIQELRSRGIPI